jgi:hypothetical protein
MLCVACDVTGSLSCSPPLSPRRGLGGMHQKKKKMLRRFRDAVATKPRVGASTELSTPSRRGGRGVGTHANRLKTK